MTTTKPTLSFFGATGGCTLACLAPALEAGYNCVALVRNPQKLTSALKARNIAASTLSTHLTLIEGSTSDLPAIKATLFPTHLAPPSMILSGVGGRPDFSNPLKPKFIGATVCQDTVRNILRVLRENTKPETPREFKPVLVCISTTGIAAERDIPLAMVPLYMALKTPHADKRVMEGLVFEEMGRAEGERVLGDYVLIRPSYLTDGESRRDKVRVLKGQGEGQNTALGMACPFVGYTICREDVGGFMFGLVEGLDGEWYGDNVEAKGREYFGSVVSISH
ncbi:uncharacterized protein DSM5745_09046 [Aspergillus mulundensis]|uniref:Uncharacterized protein n=1 Tax=Aspergillus mulundensis TaxID=1810919 RepID=A0A3D8QZT4_9EURO|nr:Uncharacterized protein DSM5745_09046 [Aspergillus mulundensis]RDW67180.1 Uncharacterized protein DSM5745_09046 [Aspergillus mulundensis]